MLSVAHRIFDPIGFTCPATLCPKILLQKTWKEKTTWDEVISDTIKNEFKCWLDDLIRLKNIKIPRGIGIVKEKNKMSVHAFCDASKVAYAVAVFLRIEREYEVDVQLIGAKTRIAPTKNVTTPRL